MALLYQSKPILLAFTLLNLPHAKTQTIDDILIKAPTAPATYTQCRDYCTLSGIRSAKCISNPSFYEGDWDILTAADWACLCDNEHYTFYSVIVGRSCGVWPVCGPVSSQIDLEYRDNCTAAAKRYNGTKSSTTGRSSTENPPYRTSTFSRPTTLPSTIWSNFSQSSYGNSTFSPTLTTSTAFTTIISTVTSCPVPLHGCSVGQVVTSSSALYTTTCPVSNSVNKTTLGATFSGHANSTGAPSGISGVAGNGGGAGSTIAGGIPAAPTSMGKSTISTSTGNPATTSSVFQAAGSSVFERGWIVVFSTVVMGFFAFAEL